MRPKLKATQNLTDLSPACVQPFHEISF